MSTKHITKGSVLDDLGFPDDEAKNLKLRAALMRSLEAYFSDHNIKQFQAAKLTGISQPRISDLLNGKISKFSIDQLVKMHERLHINIRLIIDDRLVG